MNLARTMLVVGFLLGVVFGGAISWGQSWGDAPRTPEIKPEALVHCLLEKTDFDPYTTTIDIMTGAVRICIAWQLRDKEGEIG